jgi:hypothetical protein
LQNSNNQTALLKEIVRREELKTALLADSFPEQKAYVLDKAPLVCAFCTRRAGKTMGGAKKIILTDLEKPGHKMLYISQTRETAIGQLKDDCLDPLLDNLGIQHSYNIAEARYRFRSGSSLKILGMDASENERKKALGQKYSLVVIGEGQDYETDLKKAVYQIVKPAMADLRGQILMDGTPSDNVHGLFYDVTTGAFPGWSLHKWTTFQNPHMAAQWRAEIDELLRVHGEALREVPWFRQMYLGEWVIDSDSLVYRYNPTKNLIQALPACESGERWFYTLGVDLGWDDPTSFVLEAYRDYDPVTYVAEAWKKSGMYLTDVANTLKKYRETLGEQLGDIVIDNADKQAVKEIELKTGFSLIPAEKAGKYDFIQIFNSDLQLSKIQIVGPACKPLITEYSTLIWDEKKLKKGIHLERDSCQNHCADGGLYAYRHTYSYIDRGIAPTKKTLEQEVREAEELESEELENEAQREWWENLT